MKCELPLFDHDTLDLRIKLEPLFVSTGDPFAAFKIARREEEVGEVEERGRGNNRNG